MLNLTKKIHVRPHLQIMVRIRGLGRALGRVIGRALGEMIIMIQMMFPSGEGLQHLHVGNRKLPLLLRMSLW